MKINDFVNVTKNKANSQISFNIKARQLKKAGITPQDILNIKVKKKLNYLNNKKGGKT